ncbi:glycosyltransferase family 2 protein [Ornithinibacillus californiensis]|uniref:glycosyltransferase family 2 protein n=1 Tax=Ornithinibacillus californiensis TaxID=161536 RepID=UPI00064DCCC9|nr:glycosyltransferase family 2 protein [Ornithinibacillus californiensis]
MCPNISLIVPVYNGENFLAECIDSILMQSFKNFELIIVNDGSTDDTWRICENYRDKDNRVKIINKENGGPGSARNIGITQAKGDYIGFVDSDDIINSNMYKILYKVALRDDADLVACGFHDNSTNKSHVNPIDGKLIIKGLEIKEDLEKLLIQNKILTYASLCNKLYKKSLIINNKLFINERIHIAEDLCFNLLVLNKASCISAVNEPLYSYRNVNNESLMTKSYDLFYQHLIARDEIVRIYRAIGISNEVLYKCIEYENCKTAAEYLKKIANKLKSDVNINVKFKEVNKLLHEHYFLDCLQHSNSKHLNIKARLMLKLIKFVLFIKKSLIVNF